MAIKIGLELPKKYTFEILGSDYELKVSPKALAKKAVQLQYDAAKLKASSTAKDFEEKYDATEAAAISIIDELFGEGSAAKMTGGAEVSIGWYSTLILLVLDEVTASQQKSVTDKYA